MTWDKLFKTRTGNKAVLLWPRKEKRQRETGIVVTMNKR